MFLTDLSHTARCASNTGIQRVCRAFFREAQALEGAANVRPLMFDRFADCWRKPTPYEDNFINWRPEKIPGGKRGARWRARDKFRGNLAKIGLPVGYEPISDRTLAEAEAFIAPEIFSPEAHRAYQALFPKLKGPRVAIFYDLIALRLPQFTPAGTVKRFETYLNELRDFDGIAAISAASRDDLVNHWREQGITDHPPVEAVPLGVDFSSFDQSIASSIQREPNAPPTALFVSTFEGRKNQIALLEAAELLWKDGVNFRLWFVGMLNRETGTQAMKRLEELKAAGRNVEYLGTLNDQSLTETYHKADFTVYPSLMEGFGLPIIESLHYGKPCVVCEKHALGEVAAGGGCLMVPEPTPENLAVPMRQLIDDPALRERLATEAKARTFRKWSDYARDILDFARSLRS
ncbi:MAG: glycosyltransferase family 4 protein [Puniceicoccales bacterium]